MQLNRFNYHQCRFNSALTIREINTNRTPEVWKTSTCVIMTNGQRKSSIQVFASILLEGSQHDVEESYNHPHCDIKAQLESEFRSEFGESKDGIPIQPRLTTSSQRGVPEHSATKIHSSALNPCFNVSGVDYLIENISRDLEFQDDGFATRSLDWFHESFQGLYNMYYTKYGTNHTQSTSGGGSSSGVSRDPYARLLHGLKGHTKKARTDPTMSSDKEKISYPVLSRMAMDILSVQASSVASESAFSTSGRLLTIRRTRLTPESLEMCMCLKDHLDAQERKQDTSPLELPLDVEEGVFNVEVQQMMPLKLRSRNALDARRTTLSGESPPPFLPPMACYMMTAEPKMTKPGDGHDGSMSYGYYK
ncbi:zinc finger BED domain-containing protein RICESLEEPER 2 [Tanacetum coccineum]|uniref:Zinc finger BED domain-containing protein RICESLEEPER 2 n=1 Tax=Tanacetum coccineum TaxID=301880 RepID=A0ABQ4Z9T0_9ASTR